MRAFNLSVVRVAAVAVFGWMALSGCSGGAGTTANPVTTPPNTGGQSYNGPSPATADIQAFRVEFWDNVRTVGKCSTCHSETGGQAPTFARFDDVNQAYQQAGTVVNRDSPSQSTIVAKVSGGHNCWLADPGPACASILTRWIQNWVGSTGTGGKQIELVEPTLRDPGSGKRLQTDPVPGAYKQVYDLLDLYCSGCHQSDSATAQSPFFAAGGLPTNSSDSAVGTPAYKEAYLASIPKMNINDPAQSRFVVRLGREKHNCWSDCPSNAATMQAAIQALADATPAPTEPPGNVLSKAVTLYDGTVASGGNRYESNVIALYEFKTGQGAIAFDTSGVSPAADLTLSGRDVTWVGGYGINIRDGKAQASSTASRKFHQLITGTGEYSIEAWVVPGNVTQEDARIVSYSGSTVSRNFTLGQNLYNYEAFGRSTATSANGGPKLATDDDAERLQASLQHVVVTFDPVNGRRIYVNGEFTGDMDSAGGGTLGDWDNSFAFVLGNEVSGDRQWQGVVRLAAIHNRALTQAQIKQNFEAGVGEKYFLLFSVSHLTNVPKSYIMFETTQYDSASYLFNSPKFISLDASAKPGSIPVEGMRIGVNGVEAQVGQAYRLLKTSVTDAQYSAATGQLLSSVGTIIPLEQGPDSDEFYLCFELIADKQDQCTPFVRGVASTVVNVARPSDIGVKTFDAINATMASITGVDRNNPKVKATYANVRQSLPAVHDIKGYLSSHQTSLAQLALQYCSVMIDDPTLRGQFFQGVNFSSTLAAGSADRNAVISNLYTKVVGNVGFQPSQATIQTRLDGLITTLCSNSACGGTRTADVVKAACGATLGSAATLVQ